MKVLVLTTFERDATVLQALKAGTNGFLSKGIGPSKLIAAIVDVAEGNGALSAGAAGSVIGHLNERVDRPVDSALRRSFQSLTPKEREVAIAAVSGKSNDEIAAGMFVSPYTSKHT